MQTYNNDFLLMVESSSVMPHDVFDIDMAWFILGDEMGNNCFAAY